MITGVWVSGVPNTELYEIQTTVREKMDEDLGAEDLNLGVHDVKADNLELGRTAGESIGDLFLIFGMFSIIAGLVLIINIFVMLGEERKSEMGMARAVGMKRKHLVRMYIFEGSLYAFVAAIVGALLGLFFGYVIILAFEYMFGSLDESTGGGGFSIPFHFTWGSVFLAFCAGLLITFITIFISSWRNSKLNIIRAIRKIPEPIAQRAKTRLVILGGILVVLGILGIMSAISSKSGGGYIAGGPMVFMGIALIAHKWLGFRGVITGASIAILIWMFQPYDLVPGQSDIDFSGIDSFVLSGVFNVLAAVLLVMFNSNVLLKGLQKMFKGGKSTRAVLKTAISYPMESKFKTGMTLGMFGLIIFTVTVIAMIAALQASMSDSMLREQSGGYDIIGFTNPRTPFENLSVETLPPELASYDIEEIETMSTSVVTLIDYDRIEPQVSEFGPPIGIERFENYQLVGVTDSFQTNNGFSLMERDDRYNTDTECWEALETNNSYCIVDGSKLATAGITVGGPPQDLGGVFIGGKIIITDLTGLNRTRELTVIGITDQNFFIQGIFVTKDIVRNDYGGVDSLVVVKLGSGEDADKVSKEFEKSYLGLGLQTFDLIRIINDIIALTNNMMLLMEGFLGIGLLVGIAGIGIISYRNVLERRQQIGMLRAIGFKKNMVMKSFLIETSFITILAIIMGVALGIGVGWQIYADSFRELGGSFVIPWANLIAISAIAYVATLIFTISPSISASKIPPAEALRYIE
jgi:putative ABC transport system permease protein